MAEQLIVIEVTPDVAVKIRFMAETGVFALRTGNVILNIHEGFLKTIKTEVYSHANDLSTFNQKDSLTLIA